MTIKEIFKNDLSRRIKEVIKVDDPDLETVAEEIEDYWVTDHIESEFVKALDSYQETILSPSEEVNVWVSGFFGSGKSSFAKILGYILSNPALGLSSAAELFVEQLTGDRVKALLNTIHDRAPTVSVFVDLSAGTHVLREGESIVLPLYRELLSQLGYSREPRLAELEFTLEGDGDLEEFEQLFEQANDGKVWRERRHKALAANEASAAMHLLRHAVYNEPDSWARGSSQYPELTANTFAARALELLERRRPDAKRIVFIVDEVGQYVATDVHRMLDLQGIAQAFQKEDGKLWLVATSQEALEEVVSALGGKRVELARVQDRFPIRVDLATSDIEEVVSHRVLAKSTEGKATVRKLHDDHANQLRANTQLDSAALGHEFTGDEFVQFYPLLPYQIELFIRAVSAHRARGGAGPMFGGTNRTLIRLAQQLIINRQTDLGARPLGDLATASMAYDLLEGIVPDAWRFEIDQVSQRHGGNSIDAQLAKAVALLSDVPQVPLRQRNLAVLLHSAVAAESLDRSVIEALGRLTADETLRETDDGYRLQSPEEKDWEKRRRSIDLKTGQFRRLLRERLSDLLTGVTASASREFKLGLHFEEERMSDGDIQVRILEGGSDQTDRAVRLSRDAAHESDVLVVFERSDKTWRLAEEFHRSREMIRETEARARTGEESGLLHEERKRADRFQHELDRAITTDFLSGKALFQGTEEPLAGSDPRTALSQAAAERVEKIYPHLDEWAAPVRRTYAMSVLKEDDLSGLPPVLGEDGLGLVKTTPSGHVIDKESPALGAFLQEVEKRRSYGQEASGRYLEAHFAAPPFGGDIDVIMIVAAAGVRSGAVEVTADNARLRSHADARLEKVFDSLPKFRAAAFLPREDMVGSEAKARVAGLLDELTGERTSIVTEQLAAAVTDRLADDRERLGRLVAMFRGAGLPVTPSMATAHSVLLRSAGEGDEERINSIDGARADLKDGIVTARKLDELYGEDARFELLRTAQRITARSRHDLSDPGRERVQMIQAILDSCDYVDSLADLRSAVEGILEERREAWEDAVRELAGRFDEAQREATAAVQQLPTSEAEEILRRLEAFEQGEDWSYESGPTTDRVESLISALPGVIDRIRWEAGAAAGVEVVQAPARQIYAKTVTSEDDLEALLAAIRAAAEKALGEGKYFQLS